MTESIVPLPGVLAEIAAVAGVDAALAIAEARGGTQIYIPPAPDADHWLARLVGHDAARAIADKLTCGVGGMRVDLPLGPKGHAARIRAEVDRMIHAGRSERDIALATGYTIRGVRRRAAKIRTARDDRQLPLF
ncbi:MAG: helix-turn-helix domain-containing protein [Pseudomonadota bacterium]